MERTTTQVGKGSVRTVALPWLAAVALAVTGCAGGGVGSAGPAAPSVDDRTADGDTAAASEGRQGRDGEPADARGMPATSDSAAAPGESGRSRELENLPWWAGEETARTGGADTDGMKDDPSDGMGEAAPSAFVEPAEPPVPILPGALLPRNRIVAFYGNPASRRMGILGEVPPHEMLRRLDEEASAWREADPRTPVKPALHLIAVMATGDPGRDSLFRLRMPESRIEQVAGWARSHDAILFLDIQPGHSTVEAEVQRLEDWLAQPDVHLALDPEWAMPPGVTPGRQVGSMSADDINYAIDFLAGIVDRYGLPPKVLVVHRFTESMIRDAARIRRDPRVQVVINMDGWGSPPQKRAAYHDIVAPEADQFTGFKLFFHNDRRDGSILLTPPEILELAPAPVYIQYQ
ncbi:MAG: hypothetical protein ACOC5I_01050 [Gemmatimonadota bacterium]